MSTFDITGNWTPADDTKNTIEVAPTDQREVLALRDSYDPQNVIFVRKNHLTNLADAVERGRMKNLIR